MRLARWVVVGLLVGAAIAFLVALMRPRSRRSQLDVGSPALLTLCARTLRIS